MLQYFSVYFQRLLLPTGNSTRHARDINNQFRNRASAAWHSLAGDRSRIEQMGNLMSKTSSVVSTALHQRDTDYEDRNSRKQLQGRSRELLQLLKA
jgi:hypothetical protein